jgi:type I site-specific restriction endonuclease
VNICTEGFDVPECEVISMARPTKSHPVFAQAVGRALRPLLPPQGLTPTERRRVIAASTKQHATVLDFYGNTGRHKLCNTGDLLGGEFDDEVRAMAVRKAQEIESDVDMIALLNQCKEEIAKLPKARSGAGGETDQDKLYRLYAQALFHFEPHPCDALGIDPKLPEAAVEKDDAYGGSLSRATRCLENHKLRATEIGKMSNRLIVYCSRVLEDRESRGLATYPQLRALFKHGYPPTLTKAQASMKMEQIKANKGRRPADDGPNQVLMKLVDRLTVPRR